MKENALADLWEKYINLYSFILVYHFYFIFSINELRQLLKQVASEEA